MNVIFIGNPRTKSSSLLLSELEADNTIINPELSQVVFSNNKAFFCGENLANYDVMIMRSIKQREKLAILAMQMENNGKIVIDGAERVLKHGTTTKEYTSIDRSYGGIDTYILPRGILPRDYPVIVKPKAGKYCRGIYIANNEQEYLQGLTGDMIVQKYIPFEHEVRAMVLNISYPKVIYIASKKRPARRDVVMRARDVPGEIKHSVNKFIIENQYAINRKGLIGYDIGIHDGKHYIIEANYSPRFDRATRKLRINIANLIINEIRREVY